MDERARTGVFYLVCSVWAGFMIMSIVRGTDIPDFVWGVPAATYFAMHPTLQITRSSNNNKTPMIPQSKPVENEE